MHLPALIQDLAIILGVAALVTFIFHRIRQPVVLGYIIAGFIVGPFTPPFSFISDTPNIKILAELGVVFLMFTLGLEFSFRKLSRVGLPVSVSGLFQIVVMIALGYGGGRVLGWSTIDSLFLGSAISISSTTIIIKALEELKLKNRRFSEFVFGILIIEDLAAILILVLLSGIAIRGSFEPLDIVIVLAKLVLVVSSWAIIGYFVVPRFVKAVGSLGSDEMLVILSLGLCLMLVSIAARFEYSSALGAFIMGSILAETREAHRIEHLVKPLRDVFGAVFFVSIGMLVDPTLLLENWPPVLLVTALVIIGKIFSLVVGSLLTGQPIKRSVQIALSMAQIGEFSFIIASLGMTLGVISPTVYPTIVVVSLLTTFTTPYFIKASSTIALKLEHHLPLRIRQNIEAYVSRVNSRLQSPSQGHNADLRHYLSWISSGIIATVIFAGVGRWLEPHVLSIYIYEPWIKSVAWFSAIAMSAPFVWAMLLLFRKASIAGRFPVLIFSLPMTFAWIGFLSLDLLEPTLESALTLGATGILFIAFQKRLEESYLWFERQFHLTFEESDRENEKHIRAQKLAPWDTHLVRLIVSPTSEIIGKTLLQARLRETYGVNVVALHRGSNALVAPQKSEVIYPYDELLCLGSDDEIEALRNILETKHEPYSPVVELENYDLRPFLIDEKSSLIGKTIESSGIRQEWGALVVGLERHGKRNLNPAATFKFSAGDRLWVVMPHKFVRNLQAETSAT